MAHTYNQEVRLRDLRLSLTNHTPTPEQINRIERLREIAYVYGVAVVEDAPSSRAQAIALTKLEESVMWAVKAIVLEDQED
jgi:hypothetical protein